MIKLTYKEQFVLTTEQVADILGIKANNIKNNFKNSREFFVEEEDFFKVDGSELKSLKPIFNQLSQKISVGSEELSQKFLPGSEELSQKFPSGSLRLLEAEEAECVKWKAPTIGKRAASLMLWTRYGFMHHVKMVNTPQAWSLYKQMERVYFSVLEGKRAQLETPSEVKPLKLDGREVWTIRQAAEQFGRTPRQIYKALSTKQFKRGTDYYVTSAEELSRLRDENAMWIPLPIIVILASGWAKLAGRYRQLKAAAVTGLPETVLNLESKLQEQLQATQEALKAFVEIKTALV